MALGSAFRRGQNNNGESGTGGPAAAGENRGISMNCPVVTTSATGLALVIVMFFSPRDAQRLAELVEEDEFMNVDEEQFLKAKMLIVFLTTACLIFGGIFLIITGKCTKRSRQGQNINNSKTILKVVELAQPPPDILMARKSMKNFGFLNCNEIMKYHADGYSPKCKKLKATVRGVNNYTGHHDLSLDAGNGQGVSGEVIINDSNESNDSNDLKEESRSNINELISCPLFAHSRSHSGNNGNNSDTSTSISKEDYALLRYDHEAMQQSDSVHSLSFNNDSGAHIGRGMLHSVDKEGISISNIKGINFSTSKKNTNQVMLNVKNVIPGVMVGQMPSGMSQNNSRRNSQISLRSDAGSGNGQNSGQNTTHKSSSSSSKSSKNSKKSQQIPKIVSPGGGGLGGMSSMGSINGMLSRGQVNSVAPLDHKAVVE